jgi:hypothetical protein
MKKLLAVLAGVGAVLAFLAGWLLKSHLTERKPSANTTSSHEIYKEVKSEIENTPAADLVSAAPNADELRANTDGIVSQAKQRFRDRAGTVISGHSTLGID